MPKIVQVDLRQTPGWGRYLSQIGWTTATIDGLIMLIRPIPLLGHSFIKIQHPIGPIPFSKIDQIAKKYHAWLVLIEPHHQSFSDRPYRDHGYMLSPFRMTHSATILIDLTPSKAKLWASFSENARRNIRRAEDQKLRVEKVHLAQQKDDTKFRQFYSLLANLGKLKQFYIPSYDDYFKKMTALKKESIILFAYSDGQAVAAVWLICHNNRATYLQTGITSLGYQTLANYLLVWEGLKLAKSKKIPVFDFEAIYDERYPKDHPKWLNFTEFKKRFHGQIVKYPPSYLKCYSLLFKLYFKCLTIFSRS